MLSQLHVMSPRGDCIITRDFRSDSPANTADIFFRKVKAWDRSVPPVFQVDGVYYTFVKRSGIFFVFTSKASLSHCWTIELLNQLIKSFKDFCGVLSEESLRRNFILIYELIDEIIDSGYPQTTASEVLRLAVHSEAIGGNSGVSLVSNAFSMIPPQLRAMATTSVSSSTIPSSANQRPIGSTSATSSPLASLASYGAAYGVTLPRLPGIYDPPVSKNEIFVDILERLNVIMDRNGEFVTGSIDGCIQMKSYLSGNPGLRVALNEDLQVASMPQDVATGYSSSSVFDDVNFHECVDISEFDSNRILTLTPPDGEFILMNYRISKISKLPFRIYPSVVYEESADGKLQIVVSIKTDIPEQNYASGIVVCVPVVGETAAKLTATAGTVEYSVGDEKIIWSIKKLNGEATCKATMRNVESKRVGPISLTFEIPMYSTSNMQVRYLRIDDGRHSPTNTKSPFRWVRYVTQSNSYVCRV